MSSKHNLYTVLSKSRNAKFRVPTCSYFPDPGKEREIKDIPEPVERIIQLISFGKKTLPNGSAKYKSQPFPGDIDLSQRVYSGDSPFEDFQDELSQAFQALFQILTTTPEFGAPVLIRYLITGPLNWGRGDVLRGTLSDAKGETVTLGQALTSGETVKLDLLVPLPYFQELCGDKDATRYTEVTNWYVFILNEDDQEFLLTKEPPQSLERLLQDARHYGTPETSGGAGKHYNPLKALKRVWSACTMILAGPPGTYPPDKITRAQELITTITPLFQSIVALCNSSQKDLELIKEILDYGYPADRDYLAKSAENSLYRIFCYQDEDCGLFDPEFTRQSMEELQRHLDEFDTLGAVIGSIQETVNKFVQQFLTQLHYTSVSDVVRYLEEGEQNSP